MRYLNIIGEINDNLEKEVMEKTLKFIQEDEEILKENNKIKNEEDQQKFEDLTIYINSCGGNISLFSTMHDLLHNYKGKIITIAVGDCCSCGLYLFMLGEIRKIGYMSRILYHEGSYGIRNKIEVQLEYAKYSSKNQEKINNYIIKKTNIDKEELNKYKDKDWWITSEEALKYGFATEIIGTEKVQWNL